VVHFAKLLLHRKKNQSKTRGIVCPYREPGSTAFRWIRLVINEAFRIAWDQLVDRSTGPLYFRFILQPLVASIIAIRAGLKDARSHRSACLWTLMTERGERRLLVRSAVKDVGRLFFIAVALDCVNQIIVLHLIHPVQALIVAFVLAIIPYVVVRGPVTRIASRRIARPG
jgi:hypothetical protein